MPWSSNLPRSGRGEKASPEECDDDYGDHFPTTGIFPLDAHDGWLAQRLAESFETALRVGQGVARVAFMDEAEKPELIFSDKFACPICNYSLSELEPRLFSFNSPIGACPATGMTRSPGCGPDTLRR